MIIMFAVIRDRNTNSIEGKNPSGRALKTKLLLPIPPPTPNIRHRLPFCGRFLTATIDQIIPLIACEAVSIISIPRPTIITDRNTKSILPKICPMCTLLTYHPPPLSTKTIHSGHIKRFLHTAPSLQLKAAITTHTCTILRPYPTFLINSLAHSFFVKVPACRALNTVPVMEGFAPSIDWLG